MPPVPAAYLVCSPARADSSSSRGNCVISSNVARSSGFSAAKKRASSTASARSGVANRAASLSCCSSVPAGSWVSCSSAAVPRSLPSAASSSAGDGGSERGRSGCFSPSIVKRGSFGGGSEERVRTPDVDLRVSLRLVHLDQLQPRHLQDREEGGNDAVPIAVAQVREQGSKGDAVVGAQTVGDHRNADADRDPLDEYLVRDLDLALCEYARHQLDQPVDGEVRRLEVCDLPRSQRQVLLGAPEEHVAAELRTSADPPRGILVLLVLEQPADELLSGIRSCLTFGRLGCLLARQEHARLDVGQRGGHQEVFAGQIDVQRLRRVHVLEVPVGDEADGDVED